MGILSFFKHKPKKLEIISVQHKDKYATEAQKYLNIIWITFNYPIKFESGNQNNLFLMIDKKDGIGPTYQKTNTYYIDEIVQQYSNTIRIDCAFDDAPWELIGAQWDPTIGVITASVEVPKKLEARLHCH